MPAGPISGLSFPPLLDDKQWRGASQGRVFPGQEEKQRLRARKALDDAEAKKEKFGISPELLDLPLPPPPSINRAPGTMPSKMPLYDTVWPGTTAPTFSVFDYCKKVGHAPPPNYMPAPRVLDMKVRFWHAHPARRRARIAPRRRTPSPAPPRLYSTR